MRTQVLLFDSCLSALGWNAPPNCARDELRAYGLPLSSETRVCKPSHRVRCNSCPRGSLQSARLEIRIIHSVAIGEPASSLSLDSRVL